MRKIPNINNLVIKIGSNILADTESGINDGRVQSICDIIAELRENISRITVVSSGAIAAGFKTLGFKKKPKEIIDKQACAAVGQARLMWYYEKAFKKYDINVAQILITKYDFSNRTRYLNARSTITRLHELGVIPIINENDTVVVNELKYVESFGDNDNLGALVSGLIEADMMVIMSDVNGLYTADPSVNPDAVHISEVDAIDKNIMALAGSSKSGVGTGGMHSKLTAVQKAIQAGCSVAIINGKDPSNLKRLFNGEDVGTFFKSSGKSSVAKKHWLTYATIPQGTLTIDDGAFKAIKERHSSLLAAGVTDVSGTFQAGDVVKVISLNGDSVAIGLIRHGSDDLAKIKQKPSSAVKEILGHDISAIVIHCDEMGIL